MLGLLSPQEILQSPKLKSLTGHQKKAGVGVRVQGQLCCWAKWGSHLKQQNFGRMELCALPHTLPMTAHQQRRSKIQLPVFSVSVYGTGKAPFWLLSQAAKLSWASSAGWLCSLWWATGFWGLFSNFSAVDFILECFEIGGLGVYLALFWLSYKKHKEAEQWRKIMIAPSKGRRSVLRMSSTKHPTEMIRNSRRNACWVTFVNRETFDK